MKSNFLRVAIGCAALSLTIVVATASERNQVDAEQHFSKINEVFIDNFTGLLEIRVEGSNASVKFQDGDTPFPFKISQNGKKLMLVGEERPKNYNIHHDLKWRQHKADAFSTFLKDYPILTISVPRGTNLTLDDAITITSIGDLQGNLIIDGGYLEAVIGDVHSADLSVHGAGNLIVGTVRDTLEASIHGSGDITVTSAGNSNLSIHGSGDINIGEIHDVASIQIHGSGDVGTGNIAKNITAEIHGSGDIMAGSVGRGGDFSIHGSGNIMMLDINGPVDAKINGSGDITIAHGHAKNLTVAIGGSGQFFFGGESTNLSAYANGSGDIEVATNTGSIKTSGRGTIRVNGKKIRTNH